VNQHTELRDAFASPDSLTERTIVVVDVNGSTRTKETQPQAAWLPSTGWYYDTVTRIGLEAAETVIIKYIGDGIMLVFDVDQATDAVNAAIRIQETIKGARGADGVVGTMKMTCSVGISSGDVIGFTTPDGAPDFVGAHVDKAFRLCSAANANAIFVDTPTLGAASPNRLRSRVGEAMRWTWEEYLGDQQRTTLKGFAAPVTYHELKWDHQLYGVASAEITANIDRLSAVAVGQAHPVSTGLLSAAGAAGCERHRGEVTCWQLDRGYGFIRDTATGESFWFCPKRLVYSDSAENLFVGTELTFTAVGTAEGKKSRQAGAILVVGEQADGPLVSQPVGKPYGWIRVEDEQGNRQLVYVPQRELSGCKVGDILGFTVSANDKGALASRVEPIAEDEAASETDTQAA
jgi:class 3 adenylate cyclase